MTQTESIEDLVIDLLRQWEVDPAPFLEKGSPCFLALAEAIAALLELVGSASFLDPPILDRRPTKAERRIQSERARIISVAAGVVRTVIRRVHGVDVGPLFPEPPSFHNNSINQETCSEAKTAMIQAMTRAATELRQAISAHMVHGADGDPSEDGHPPLGEPATAPSEARVLTDRGEQPTLAALQRCILALRGIPGDQMIDVGRLAQELWEVPVKRFAKRFENRAGRTLADHKLPRSKSRPKGGGVGLYTSTKQWSVDVIRKVTEARIQRHLGAATDAE